MAVILAIVVAIHAIVIVNQSVILAFDLSIF